MKTITSDLETTVELTEETLSEVQGGSYYTDAIAAGMDSRSAWTYAVSQTVGTNVVGWAVDSIGGLFF